MNNTNHNLIRVEAAMDAMRQAIMGARERLGEGLQLTRTQIGILILLIEGPQTTGELARRMLISPSAVTQTIDTLVRRDLIERHADEADRRIIQLHLSPAGREITDNLASMRRRYIESLIEHLTEEEIRVFISITEKMTAQLKVTKPTKEG
jgi:DNA-binding MarR family transcriptional regulator